MPKSFSKQVSIKLESCSKHIRYFAGGSTVYDMIRLYCFVLGKNLLVGTNKGHLLVYEVREYGKSSTEEFL